MPTATASAVWLTDTIQNRLEKVSKAYLKNCQHSATPTEVEVECIHAIHFLPVPDHQLREHQKERTCDLILETSVRSNLGWLPSSYSPVFWHPKWAFSTWWHHIQRPPKHRTTDLEIEDQAIWLQYWGARLVTQSTRNSALARYEQRNHWLHPEMPAHLCQGPRRS